MNEGQDWIYTDIVKEHFMHPRNFLFGDESKFKCDAVGIVGNPICGDQMKMHIKVRDDKIEDIRWKKIGRASL
jgi:NifU-like protein involved in Fe-S cluster formation